MKPDFRKCMIWLHTYSGLLIGWLLFAIFVTGTLSYFNPEISQWMKPELGSNKSSDKLLNQSLTLLNKQSNDSERWQINLPTQRNNQFVISWYIPSEKRAKRFSKVLDSETYKEITVRDSNGGNFFRTFHYTLEMRQFGGRYIAGIAAMVMLIGVFTGIFTHRRFFKDFFTLRLNKLIRTLTDTHAVMGVITIPYCFVICFSALLIYISIYVPFSAQHHYDNGYRDLNKLVSTSLPKIINSNIAVEPIKDLMPIVNTVKNHWPEESSIKSIVYERPFDSNGRIIVYRNPLISLSNKEEAIAFNAQSGEQLAPIKSERIARKIRRIFYGLHEAHFATPMLRWLLFFMGVASCILIASGLIIWLKKRLDKVKKRHFGHLLVERLNIAGIAGLLLAITSYFYANRIIPINIESRAELEVSAFLIVWLICLIYSFLRPALKAWTDIMLVTGLALSLLPVVDFLIEKNWLINALENQNMAYIGFNLALLISGGVCLKIYSWLKGINRKNKNAVSKIKNKEEAVC